ncbi:hypothetical protein DBR40_05235 [Pedobacter sp. KBW01]|uniref:hypothetical protein n=1 Tax=Pedobacter sp. KBW01 TaxID=2153364 RepID=UPI000F5B2867|nr:hypothetical protein [Pedobacter sp. KBW01]RQO79124.1 hypothetical protein DBR40_05235 [Pedobacter sp. KBW01]
MAKEIYVRTPESNRTIQDDDIKAANIFEMPVITSDNEDDQRPGCLGMKSGTPHYHNGTEMVPISSGIKPAIPVTSDLTINWQTELVSGTAKTYAQIFGNHIFDVKGVWNDGGVRRPYTPDWSYTKSGVNIDTVTINAVFEGEITFI